MNKKLILPLIVSASAAMFAAGCGTKTVVVQSAPDAKVYSSAQELATENNTENNTTEQQLTVTGESNSGQLSKKDSEIMTTVAIEATTTEAITDAASNKDEYFFYDSDKRLLTESDLEGLSADEMRLARNEIFARRGRKFKEKELSDYYSSKSWYNPTIDSDDFNSNVTKYLNNVEISNAEFIKSVETKRVLDSIEGKWETIRLYDDIEYTFNGDMVENNIGGSYIITDVVRAYSCANTGEVTPGEEGYMIFVDSDYYEVRYYYYYDNEQDYLELHTEDENGRHMSYGGDSLQRIK